MRPKNISFGEVIRSKQQKSPQLQLKNKPMTLNDLMRQWENDPENNFTLYLGHNQPQKRSQFSSSRMLSSSNLNSQTHFDNWIENQRNPDMQDIENSQGFRGNKVSKVTKRMNFNQKSQESGKGPKTMGELVRKHKQVYLVQNSSQFANSVGYVQMIKSKTCQTNQKKHFAVKQSSYRRALVTDHIQLQDAPPIKQQPRTVKEEPLMMKEEHLMMKQQPRTVKEEPRTVKEEPLKMKQQSRKMKEHFHIMKETNESIDKCVPSKTCQAHEFKKDMKFKSLLQNKKKQDTIDQLVENTKNNIAKQIAQLALKYAENEEQHPELSFQQSSSRAQETEQQQEDELLIDDSEKKPPNKDGPIFSQGYEEKARKAQETDRLRKEEAKNRINDLMKNYKPLKRNDQIFKMPEMKFGDSQRNQQALQNNYEVGFSFASSQPEQLTKYQNISNQDHMYENTQQQQSLKDIKLQSSEQVYFNQKYVNYEINAAKTFYNVFENKSERQQQGRVNQNKPNNSFQTKFITTVKQEQPKLASYQAANNFNKHQFFRENSSEQFIKIQVVSKQLKNSSVPQATQMKVDVQKTQNKSFNQQFGKFPHQKIKLVSSAKNYSNSNRSHKSGSAKSSSEKASFLQLPKEIKTQPFAPILQTPQNQVPKEVLEIKDNNHFKQRCSPFKTIKQVKNSIVNPFKHTQAFQINVIQDVQVKKSRFEPYAKEKTKDSTQSQKHTLLQLKSQQNQQNYVLPTYGTKKINSSFQNKLPSTRECSRNPPLSYALPTDIQESNFAIKNLNNSKQGSNQYQLPTYSQKQIVSPKTSDYPPKYESLYATSISSSYQVCEKFNSILNLTKKEFPQNKQKATKHQEPTYSTNNQITAKRSFLNELDIKQSIDMQEVGKRTLGLSKVQQSIPIKKTTVPVRETTSGLDNVIKKSLKRSINLQGSGQFEFDF